MAFHKQYGPKEIETVIKLWADGYSAAEIGDVIGKTKYSVCQFMHRNRDKYGFERREGGRHYSRVGFEKQWHGVVPLGHWMITKPWKKHSNPMQNEQGINQ